MSAAALRPPPDPLTRMTGSALCKVSAWYDNEWACSHRMLGVARVPAGLR